MGLNDINDLKGNGAPKGNRTPVFAVKGRRPRPLDDGRGRGAGDGCSALAHAAGIGANGGHGKPWRGENLKWGQGVTLFHLRCPPHYRPPTNGGHCRDVIAQRPAAAMQVPSS